MTVEKEFGADPNLKKLYGIYLAFVVLGGFLWWMIPAVVGAFLVDAWIGS